MYSRYQMIYLMYTRVFTKYSCSMIKTVILVFSKGIVRMLTGK